jgi:hypothetical protein
MSLAPAMKHQRIAYRLDSQFYYEFRGKPCEVSFAPLDVRLIHKDKKTNSGCTTRYLYHLR